MSTRLLIIPDIHQDHDFLDAILSEQDVERFDRVIFLGDYIDAKRSTYDSRKSLKKVVKRIRQLHELLGRRLVLIPGNHDLPYFGARPRQGTEEKTNLRMSQYGCGPIDPDYLALINKHWSPGIWESFTPLHFERGYLFSHAGVSQLWWEALSGDVESLELFIARANLIWQEAMEQGGFSNFFEAGAARGGMADCGGPFWLDFHEEFTDELPFPQIVGHTSGSFARKAGLSWCLDARQSVYAILHDFVEIIRVKGR